MAHASISPFVPIIINKQTRLTKLDFPRTLAYRAGYCVANPHYFEHKRIMSSKAKSHKKPITGKSTDTLSSSRELRSFKRRLEILTYIRQSRLPVETGEIIQHIQDKGLLESDSKATANRMINRDLNELSDNKNSINEFGLRCTRGDRNSWTWWIDAIESQWHTDVKSMPQEVALALALTEKHLQKNMPTTTFRVLQNHVENAREKMLSGTDKADRKNLQRLISRVEINQRGQRLMDPSHLDMNVLNTIYEALAKNKRLHIKKKKKQ
ncbi:MAG: hypothetical protein KDI30_01570, partial [Pseudomonadales bacterium]|nr:hypothetical protein [Pseudomonadales bacterium]